MTMSSGQKLGLLTAAGVGVFLLAGGSKSAAAAPPIDPCIAPKDCTALTLCAGKIMATATKADVPTLQGMLTTAKTLGCTELAKQLTTLISTLSAVAPKPGDVFSASNIKDRATLINKAWTLARMGIGGPGLAPPSSEDVAKYHLGSDWSFGDVSDAINYANEGKTGIVDVKTGEFISRSPQTIITELQRAAGLTVDGKFGTQSRLAWSWGLKNGSPSSIGGEGLSADCGHDATVAGCTSCSTRPISNAESLGAYDTLPALGGSVVYDRAFGSQFGAGPSKGPLSKYRAFGQNARFGY